MDLIYVLLYGSDWEDITIILSKEDAINETIKNPSVRVEIFSKNNDLGYTPTYNYYKNGVLVKTLNI